MNHTKLEIINTGYFYADGGAMFGSVPKVAWEKRYPCNEKNACVLAIRSLLVTTPEGKIILIDNGAGNKHLKQLSYYQFFNVKDLGKELQIRGIQKEDITDVILTHLHFDHCGYTTSFSEDKKILKLNFPNATHWINRKQWENSHSPHPLEKDSYFNENVDLLLTEGKLNLLEEEQEIASDIELKLYDGHTPGQIVPYIKDREKTFIFAGDVIPLAASVSLEWISAYDTYPLTSYQEKIRMLEEAALENQIIIYCHDAYTCYSSIKKVNTFYKPVTENLPHI